MDGGGYPAGLIASEIPLASRIIAICSTYDTMTKRETFGPPMDGEEAIDELRTISGSQLDAELVAAFVGLLERNGHEFGRDADYKVELEFENRVRKLAQPKSEDISPLGRRPVAVRLRRRD
jgi:HD-GYP domain-containing protein (c-di-GMP phosphodiesterase class II)